MRSALGVLLAALGGVVIAFGTFGLATTIHFGPRSFGATAVTVAPPAAVGVLLLYGAAAVARWAHRSLVFGIVAVVSGAPLIFLGLILKFGLPDSPSDVAEAARPFLSAGAVLLMVGAALITCNRAVGRVPSG